MQFRVELAKTVVIFPSCFNMFKPPEIGMKNVLTWPKLFLGLLSGIFKNSTDCPHRVLACYDAI